MQKRKLFRIKERKEIIAELTLEYGLRCWYCGYKFEPKDQIHIDHIQPVSQGGKNDIKNLALSCRYCNPHKFYYSVGEFLSYLARIRTSQFSCPILEKYKASLTPIEYDILKKSFY